MKRMNRKKSEKSIVKSQGNKKRWLLKSLFAMVILFILPINVMASQQRFVLNFNDSHMRGYKGESATIFLKKALKDQYPWVRISDFELKKVVLVAKSKMGRGGAELRVGKWATGMNEVGGNPDSFRDRNRFSFDRVRFWNPSKNSNGPWQIGLRGDFIVRKVVLEVKDHGARDRYSRWNRNRR